MPKERARRLLPPHHAAPLVIQHGQIPPGVHHAAPVLTEQRLRRRPDAQPLFQILTAPHRHPRALRRKALHVVFLLLQEGFRDEQGHGYVGVSGFLELPVHLPLDVLPNRVAVGPENEHSLYAGVADQFRLDAYVRVPLGEILFHVGNGLDLPFLFCHSSSAPPLMKSMIPYSIPFPAAAQQENLKSRPPSPEPVFTGVPCRNGCSVDLTGIRGKTAVRRPSGSCQRPFRVVECACCFP